MPAGFSLQPPVLHPELSTDAGVVFRRCPPTNRGPFHLCQPSERRPLRPVHGLRRLWQTHPQIQTGDSVVLNQTHETQQSFCASDLPFLLLYLFGKRAFIFLSTHARVRPVQCHVNKCQELSTISATALHDTILTT